MSAFSLPSRWMLFTGAVLAFLVIGGGFALACTLYYGTNTIENLSTSSGEYTVVGDPHQGLLGQGMDRCDGAGSGSHFSASNDDQDKVRVEIAPYNGTNCNTDEHGDTDGDGTNDHSLADTASSEVFINTYNGDAYDDDPNDGDNKGDGDGVYEDTDTGRDLSEQPDGEVSEERIGDCMGSGTGDSNVINKKGPILIDKVGDVGQFHPNDSATTANGAADADNDGVNDVDITINQAPDSSADHASAVCVSDGEATNSAPQIPLVIS